MRSEEFLGVRFDTPTPLGAEEWLGSRTSESDYAYVITPNTDHLVRLAREDDEIRAGYRDADLCLCDSRVVARIAALCGVRLTVVPGSDLVVSLFERILKPGDRLCLIGGSEQEARMLAASFPSFDIVQHIPPMGLRREREARGAAASFAVGANARVILIAVGSPQQEMIAHEIAALPGATGTALCVGAAVAFLAGTQTRAPLILRRLSLEWAWRLALDPRRLARRYLVDGFAIFPMAWRWHRTRLRRVP